MIKRSFIKLTGPRLLCDRVEPDPKKPETIPIPPRLVLLLHEPLDSTRETLIKKGDMVKRGERLFLYKESTEYAVSPVSGTITSIASYTGDFGTIATYFIVERDEKDTSENEFAEFAETPDLKSADSFLRSLPGAPSLSRFLDPDRKINTLVIEGSDSDLMSTTRQYLLATAKEEIKRGIQILRQMTGVAKIAITVPENGNDALSSEGVQVFKVSRVYPKALPQMVMKDHLEITVLPGATCEDHGVTFMSVEAVISLARTYTKKDPVYDKVLTVIAKDGTRHLVKAVIGTPLHRIFKQFNLQTNERDRIIIGGPMTGFAAYTLYHPVEPAMDTIQIQDREEIPYVSDYPCINCGKCVRACPANVPVNLLVRYLEADLYEEAADSFDLQSCIECGLCSYVCTARIPLFQYIRLGKHQLTELESEATNA